jgi:hypothetical protein
MPTITELESADEFSAVSWGAVIAGAVVAAAVTLLLAAFGSGVGFSIISPWSDQGASGTTFHITAGLYLLAITMLASTIGGYVAGRLRSKWSSVHGHERFFRDTAHGLLVWALATVVSAAVLGGATTHLLAGASAGLAPAAASAGGSPTDVYVDRLLRSDTNAAGAAGAATAPAAGVTPALRAEIGRALATNMRPGAGISDEDRNYLTNLVAARTGLPQAEAQRRVADVTMQAKTAAEDARKAARNFSFWLAFSMLAGAFVAALGAVEGGKLRDARWYEPGWRPDAARRTTMVTNP